MTIAAGFAYPGGVLLCSDSQFTASPIKLDGIKLDLAEPDWGKVLMAFSGNGEFAAGAYYTCLDENWTKGPGRVIRALSDSLEKYYRRHVFRHPLYKDVPGELGYDFLLAIKIKTDGVARLLVTNDTVIHPVHSFSCIGSGSDVALPLMSLLWVPGISEQYAIAMAAHVLHYVKKYADGCGGRTRIRVLRDDGTHEDFSDTYLVRHAEHVSNAFATEATRLIVGHTEGTVEEFTKRLEKVTELALQFRDFWDNPQDWEPNPREQSGPGSTTGDQSFPQPSQESPRETGES